MATIGGEAKYAVDGGGARGRERIGEGGVARRWPPGQRPTPPCTARPCGRHSASAPAAARRGTAQLRPVGRPSAACCETKQRGPLGAGKKRSRVRDGVARTVTYAVALHPPHTTSNDGVVPREPPKPPLTRPLRTRAAHAPAVGPYGGPPPPRRCPCSLTRPPPAPPPQAVPWGAHYPKNKPAAEERVDHDVAPPRERRTQRGGGGGGRGEWVGEVQGTVMPQQQATNDLDGKPGCEQDGG